MKKIILIFTTIFSFFCKAQEYSLNTSPADIPNNAYIKDINNELDQYVGLWKGTWNGKILYLDLKKVKYHYDGNHPYYIDKILGERKVATSDGTIEIDRISNFDYISPEFRGIYKSLRFAGKKTLTFSPKNMCRKTATLEITSFTISQMTLHFEYEPSPIDSNCQHNGYIDQYGDFPINFPKDIVLTKQ
ncbi:hypothetical protein C1637_25030 [Chryseobacterium lactis]|uniref:DUF6705 domain-containing protein n=1 Tax=Chryseobacterium lactis TaxID=1241981 RepID=A0AA92BAX7_CHRLC|nr:DUF6705 family protein [Chryseobacterium lactis]PNW10938.1 hypothetical protein C1637_25030 [Chryseobacterium lactis]